MPAHLSTADADFETRFQALLAAKREEAEDVSASVAAILSDVRARGDAALIDYTERFDGLALSSSGLRISADEVAEASARLPDPDKAALELAAARIEAFHREELPKDARWTDAAGVEMGWRWRPVDAAGLYVPGGAASYPSSVLMNALPARVAGVRRLAMCVPTPRGEIHPMVLYAASLAGVDEIYRVGGAQAIGALAYGAESIAPVDVIVGPGNAYVAAAKRQVFGKVGIDSIAGPSEIVIVADRGANPDWLAMDLLAQAEHDAAAQSILISDDADLLTQTAGAVARALDTLPRAEIAGASWRDHGATILVRDFEEATALVDRLAPEHLELAVADPDGLAADIRHAGAIFLGHHTPEALGDYLGGPNHVLPTARAARYASGLSTYAFLKRTTILQATPEALAELGPSVERLAEAEGLHAHGRSVAIRGNGGGR
ncbi:MAG: histidinol dehydrogenase [Pseudomonadota bacterium]